jgi:hypothetical protein
MRRREKKIRLLAVETVKEMVLLLKRIKMRRRTRQRVKGKDLRMVLLQEKVRKAPPSELLMVRIHQITDSIYMHVSRTKFGMVMQIHRK